MMMTTTMWHEMCSLCFERMRMAFFVQSPSFSLAYIAFIRERCRRSAARVGQFSINFTYTLMQLQLVRTIATGMIVEPYFAMKCFAIAQRSTFDTFCPLAHSLESDSHLIIYSGKRWKHRRNETKREKEMRAVKNGRFVTSTINAFFPVSSLVL